MQSRPGIDIEPTKRDRIINTVSMMILILMWTVILFVYSRLPEEIPSHFNAAGKIDGYSKPSFIFMLPIVGSFVYFLLTFISKYPHQFNFPTEITEENAKRKYTAAVQLLSHLKLAVLLVISMIIGFVLKAGLYGGAGPGIWLLPLIFVLILSPIIYYFVKG